MNMSYHPWHGVTREKQTTPLEMLCTPRLDFLKRNVGPEFDILSSVQAALSAVAVTYLLTNYLFAYDSSIMRHGWKCLYFRQGLCVALVQVNYGIQQGINIRIYDSPFVKLSQNTTTFFCKVDCCNILSICAI